MVSALNSWWPDAQIFRSTDSGATWSRIWEWGADGEMSYHYSLSVSCEQNYLRKKKRERNVGGGIRVIPDE